MHCDDHPCYEKCPKKDKAMLIDDSGIVYINEDECIGCGLCVKACPYGPPRINMVKSKDKKQRKAKKCDLCRNRPEGPACVEWCPVRCIGVSDE
jgi:Fe-S-cluster-containing dehydrogenase component